MSECIKLKNFKYSFRNSPPYPANKCKTMKKKGNDGKLYLSQPDKNGTYKWLNVNKDVNKNVNKSVSKNNASNDILDLEFALATDVVLDARGNPVCRQQTLAAPEAVNVRNPFLTNLNIATGITPSKAQIDSCVPLNLFGVGAASAAAINYVTAQADSNNKAEQKFASVQLGGNLYTLPAGDILFNTEMQWRREDLAFTPNRVAELGLARTTISQPGLGYAVFREAGVEASIPVFNGGFALPFVGDVHVGE
jgi:hypothetical protein